MKLHEAASDSQSGLPDMPNNSTKRLRSSVNAIWAAALTLK